MDVVPVLWGPMWSINLNLISKKYANSRGRCHNDIAAVGLPVFESIDLANRLCGALNRTSVSIRGCAEASTQRPAVESVKSGWRGTSYGAETPVKFAISPDLARPYNPLGSRASQSLRGVSTNTSRNEVSPEISLTTSRSARNGEIIETIVTSPDSAMSLATSAARRIFSLLSTSLKPKSRLRPCLRLSPSMTMLARPALVKARSTTSAILDFPAPERPVNQAMTGLCPSARHLRSRGCRSCQVRFRSLVVSCDWLTARLALSGTSRTTFTQIRDLRCYHNVTLISEAHGEWFTRCRQGLDRDQTGLWLG